MIKSPSEGNRFGIKTCINSFPMAYPMVKETRLTVDFNDSLEIGPLHRAQSQVKTKNKGK